MNTKRIKRTITCLTLCVCLSATANAHEWMAPKESASMKSPIQFDNQSIERGRLLYSDNCVSCHGDLVLGQNAKDVDLSKDAPNLIRRLSSHTEGDFFWKIQEGKGEMPSFQEDLEPNEIWDIIHFIKSSM